MNGEKQPLRNQDSNPGNNSQRNQRNNDANQSNGEAVRSSQTSKREEELGNVNVDPQFSEDQQEDESDNIGNTK